MIHLLGLLILLPVLLPAIGTIINTTGTRRDAVPDAGAVEDSGGITQEEIRRTLYEAHRALDSRQIRGISAWIDSCMYRIETDRYLPVEMALFALEETANEMKMRGYDPEILVPAFIKLAGIAEPGGEA